MVEALATIIIICLMLVPVFNVLVGVIAGGFVGGVGGAFLGGLIGGNTREGSAPHLESLVSLPTTSWVFFQLS